MAQDIASEWRIRPDLVGGGKRIGIVCGRFNDHITIRLLEGAQRGLASLGVQPEDQVIEWVPGAYELPFAAQTLIDGAGVDAVIALGCVIRGETSHYDFVAGECAAGLQQVQLARGVPVIFGVLTTENLAQALERSAGPGEHNVGEESALTAIEMVQLRARHA